MVRARSMTGRFLILAIGASLIVVACGGSASAAPTLAPGATATPAPTATSDATAPVSSDGTPDGTLAFSAATSALDALDSYEFQVEIATSKTTAGVATKNRTVWSGVVVNRPEKASSMLMDEYDAGDTITSSTGIMIIGASSWTRNGASDPWVAIPAAQAALFIQSFAAYRPEQVFGLYFAALGNDFTSAGTETKNGVPSTHYKGGDAIGSILSAIAGFQGNWNSDVWLATDGGFLVHSEASGDGLSGADTGSFLMKVDISKPNAAGPITPPG